MRRILLLAACAAHAQPETKPDATPDPAETGARIEIFSGTYRHNTEMTVLDSDAVQIRRMRPEGVTEETLQGREGLFDDIAAVIAAQGPALAADVAGRSPCPDFGGMAVEAEPEISAALSTSLSSATVFDELAGWLEAILAAAFDQLDGDRRAAGPWARALLGAVSASVFWWQRERTVERDELVEHLTALIWSGFVGAGGEHLGTLEAPGPG